MRLIIGTPVRATGAPPDQPESPLKPTWRAFLAVKWDRGSVKPMTEHKIGLMIGENKAFIERIAWYSVGIVNLLADVDHKDRRMSDALGTGTACTWKSHSLILTAEHVVARTEPSNLAFLRVDDAIKLGGCGQARGSSRESVSACRPMLSVARSTTWRLSFFVATI